MTVQAVRNAQTYIGPAADRVGYVEEAAIGDYYFEDDTGLTYRKSVAGAWVQVSTLTRPQTRVLSDNFIAPAAGDYADNDVISDSVSNGTGTPMEFANAVPIAGSACKIIGADLSCDEDSVAATSELFLFSQAPTASEMDDNAAWGGVGAADGPYLIGSIAFGALADVGAYSFIKATSPTPAAPLLAYCVATSIFGILVLRDAETNETAGMRVTVRLYVE